MSFNLYDLISQNSKSITQKREKKKKTHLTIQYYWQKIQKIGKIKTVIVV